MNETQGQLHPLWALKKHTEENSMEKGLVPHLKCQTAATGTSRDSRRTLPFTVVDGSRVTEHWLRLPREAVESPCLEILKTHLDTVLGNVLWVSLLDQRGWSS